MKKSVHSFCENNSKLYNPQIRFVMNRKPDYNYYKLDASKESVIPPQYLLYSNRGI